MPDPIQFKMGAYLDGELKQPERLEVENHLKTCQACREELEELKRISSLLQESHMPEFTSPMDFKAQVMLQLPRREETIQQGQNAKFLWVAPVMVFLAFIFVQVTLNLSTLVELARQAGWVNISIGLGSEAPEQMLWFTALQNMVGDLINAPGLAWLNVLNDAGLVTLNVLITLFVQAVMAILYWGVLTLAWRKTVGSRFTGMTGE
jgi:predicted anti-sigma-YlaC factor YlaD